MHRLLVLSAALSTGCVTAIDRSYTFSEDIHTIDFNVEAGEVTVLRSASDRIELMVEFGGPGRAEGPIVRDGVLFLDYHCEGLGICGGEITIEVPHGVTVTGHLSMGDLSIEDIGGVVDVSTDTGSISAEGLYGPWIRLVTGAGDVSAELSVRPEALYAAVGAGAVDLTVPAGVYDLDVDLSVGAIEVAGIIDNQDASDLIHARVGTGDLSISGQ